MANPRRNTVRIQPIGAGKMQAQPASAGNVARRTTQTGVTLDQVKAERVSPLVRLDVSAGSYDVKPTDRTIWITGGAGALRINLPPAREAIGAVFTIKKMTPLPVVTIVPFDPLGADFIDNAATMTMNGADRACLVTAALDDGFGWAVVSTFGTVV